MWYNNLYTVCQVINYLVFTEYQLVLNNIIVNSVIGVCMYFWGVLDVSMLIIVVMFTIHILLGAGRSLTATPSKPLLTPNPEDEGRSFESAEMSMEYFFASDARYGMVMNSVQVGKQDAQVLYH